MYWGELENPDPVEDQIEVTCPVTVETAGTSASCEVKFQADEISGKATLIATVDEIPDTQDETNVEIGFFSLTDASPLITRPKERRRSPDTLHIDADAFHVRSVNALQQFIAKYQVLTTSPAHPSGRYMNFNDFSLPHGGKFDIEGQWSVGTQRHLYHRDGEGVDVMNDKDTDIATGMQVAIDRAQFIRACKGAGGIDIKEGPFHCEFGSPP